MKVSAHQSLPVLQFSCSYLGYFYPTCAFCRFLCRFLPVSDHVPRTRVHGWWRLHCIAVPHLHRTSQAHVDSETSSCSLFLGLLNYYGMYFTHRARALPRPVELNPIIKQGDLDEFRGISRGYMVLCLSSHSIAVTVR